MNNFSVMFPARAGMSRTESYGVTGARDVPRASGDEPYSDRLVPGGAGCSPRERG